MPKDYIVADDISIINTQGVRWVEKFESNSTHYQPDPRAKYGLRVKYKGDLHTIYYMSQSKRDAQYEALINAMHAKVTAN